MLQPEFRKDDEGHLDDIVIQKVDVLHLEHMESHYWWMGLYNKDGEGIILHIIGSESGVRVTLERDES